MDQMIVDSDIVELKSNKIKCGEIFLTKKKLLLVCGFCKEESNKLESFLLHTLLFHINASENEVNTLVNFVLNDTNEVEEESNSPELTYTKLYDSDISDSDISDNLLIPRTETAENKINLGDANQNTTNAINVEAEGEKILVLEIKEETSVQNETFEESANEENATPFENIETVRNNNDNLKNLNIGSRSNQNTFEASGSTFSLNTDLNPRQNSHFEIIRSEPKDKKVFENIYIPNKSLTEETFNKTNILPSEIIDPITDNNENTKNSINIGEKSDATSRKTNYTCEFCGSTFRMNSELKSHRNRHLGIKPFICSECGKCFVSKQDLNAHMPTHTNSRTKICKHCEKSFKTSSALAMHQRTHSKERKYQCNICEKCFISTTALHNHSVGHTGERRFVCTQCGLTYRRSNALQLHIDLKHAKEKPFACKICSKPFAKEKLLNYHMKVHRKERVHNK